jgi:hypothetical protein
MAKHYSKRASKKRRAVRRLKKTIRRRLQRGGGTPEQELLKMLIPFLPGIFKIVFGNLGLFMQILTVLSGVKLQYGGSNKRLRLRQEQRGGALSEKTKQSLVDKLTTLKKSFSNDQEASSCIDSLINKINSAKTDTVNQDAQTPPIDELADLTGSLVIDIKSEIPDPVQSDTVSAQETTLPQDESTREKVKNLISEKLEKIKGEITAKIDDKIQSIKDNSGLSVVEINCIETLKNKMLKRLLDDLRNNLFSIRQSIGNITSDVTGVVSGKMQGIKDKTKGLFSRFGSK